MSRVKCSKCGARFEGGMLEWTCPACRRQGVLVGVMQEHAEAQTSAAEAQAQAGVLEAVAAAHAAQAQAEAQLRVAAAAEAEAEARVRREEMEGKAAYASAVGALDAEGLARLHEHERYQANQAAVKKIADDVAAAVACVEAGGAQTARIDSQAVREAQAYRVQVEQDGSVTSIDGVAGVYRWHNLVASERLLLEARESVSTVSEWTGGLSRDEMTARIDQAVAKARHLRADAAQSAVEDIGRSRALGYGIPLGVTAVSVGVGLGVGEWIGSLVPVLFVALPSLLVVSEWGKAKSPISYEDIRKEAGRGSKLGRITWLAVAVVSALTLLIGGIAALVRAPVAPKEPPTLVGDYVRPGHVLRVEPGWLVLDRTKRLPLGDTKLAGRSHASFERALLAKGIVFDDFCEGELDRHGNKLVVTMGGESAGGCSEFAGEWTARSRAAVPASSGSSAAATTTRASERGDEEEEEEDDDE